MEFDERFFRATAICAAVAAICVLVAQVGLTNYPAPSSRPEAILLYRHGVFVAQGWVILGQVFLMFLALWGVALKSFRVAPGLIATAAVFIVFWQILELIPRGVEMITLARVWAPRFAEADAATRVALEGHFATVAEISGALGFVRRGPWALGHLLFGLALWRGPTLQRGVAALFLYNFIRLLPRVLGELAGWSWLSNLVQGRWPFVFGMLPLFLLAAIWLWREPRPLPAGSG